MKAIIWLLIIVFCIWGCWQFFGNGIHSVTARGEHTGYITAVEKTGWFYKTGTAYVKTDTQSSQEDSYCVDLAVYDQLEKLAREKTKVTIKYEDWLIKGFKNCNGEQAVITDVLQ